MRRLMVMGAGAAVLLLAGGGTAADNGPVMQAGQYAMQGQLVSFDIDGATPAQLAAARQAMARVLSDLPPYCLTQEDAARGPSAMIESMVEGHQCHMDRYSVGAGGAVSGQLSCERPGGRLVQRLDGTMTPTSLQLTLDQRMTSTSQPQRAGRIVMRTTMRRTGACQGVRIE